ncbi:galactokinase [Brachybacterium huguangmaarense]
MTHLSEAPERSTAARRVRELFRETYGAEPDGVWSAPGRVNIIGEHVDYQDGLCLPMAIGHRCFVAARRIDEPVLRLRSVQAEATALGGAVEVAIPGLAPGAVDGWAAYVGGVLWALPGERGASDGGVELLVDGQVPLGAGLSSSAALECAAAEAFDALYGLGTAPRERIRASITAETEFAGASTGGLDQAASVLSREGEALLLDCRGFSTTPVPWDLASQDLALLICDTRAEHALVGGEYGDRRRDSEAAAAAIGIPTLRDVNPADLDEALERITDESVAAGDAETVRRRARHVITEIDRVREFARVLEEGTVREGIDRIGALMNASHDSLRDDYEVTVTELDVAVDAARAAGAHGARMTGGGFGGSVIALVEAAAASDVAATIAEAFAREDLGTPEFFLAVPSDGAGADA